MNKIINYLNNKINKINQKQKIKITMNKNMNKKIFSITIIGIAALCLLFVAGLQNVQSAETGVTFQGDLPWDSVTYLVRVYDEVNADPCPGTGALGSHVGVQGDGSYNDNDDYSITGISTTDADASIYLCTGTGAGDLKLKYEDVTVATGNAYYVDFGKIIGTSLHNDLDNDYVAVCASLGGTQLSSEDKQVSGTGEYTQYYAIDCGVNGASAPTEVYALFDQNNVAECTWDGDKSTGKEISIASAENYGVYLTFAPDTKNIGDLHADLDVAKFELYDSNSLSIGMAIETYTDAAAPDGDGADDDYTIYYDKPTSGDMWLTITSAANGSFSVYGIANASFTAGYDFYLDVEDNAGGIPDTVSHIRYAGLAGGEAVVYVQDPRVNGNIQEFDIYTDTGDATDDIEFYESGSGVAIDGSITGGTKVYQKRIDLSNPGDEVFDVGKVTGEMHSGVETGDDLVAVYSDNACTVLVSSETINPDDDGFNTTDDYEVYFEETGADYYLKITEEVGVTDYVSCGNHFTLTDQKKSANNIAIQVSGTRHADMAAVIVDHNKDGALSNLDVWTTSFVTNVYHIYTTSDTTSQVVFDGTDRTCGNILLTTVTEKNFSSDGVVDAAKVLGSDSNIHADLLNAAGGITNDLIMVTVTSANGTGVDLASIAGVIDATDNGADGDIYTCYFEVPSDGLVNMEIQDGDAANAVVAYVYNFTAAGAGNYTFEPSVKVTATVDADILGFEVQQAGLGGYNMRDNTAAPFIIYVDKTEEGLVSTYDYRAYTDAAFTTKVLDRSGKDVSGVAAWGVNEITGNIHDDFTGTNNDNVAVYDADACSTLISSETFTFTEAGTDSYKQYYESTGNNISLQETRTSGGNDYVTCIATETVQPAAGGTTAKDLTIKVSGDVGSGITIVYVDPDQDTTEEITQNVITATTPDSYLMYLVSDALSDISFYAGGTLELDRTGKVFNVNATVNVGKFTGTNHADLNAGTIVVYQATACTTALSSQAENPVGGTWTQYFEGTSTSTYYTSATGGGFTTCKGAGDALVDQEASSIDFARKISGTIPDESTVDATALGAANSISSVGVDLTSNGTTNEYLSAVVDGGGATTYQIYVDSVAGNDSDNQINFWGVNNGTGGPLLARQDQSLASNVAIDTSMMWGEADANLEAGANDYIKVCDDNLASITHSTAGSCTTYINTNDAGNGITIADNGFGTGDYSIHFIVGADTEAYLEIENNDATAGITYAYRRVGTADGTTDVAVTAGDIFNVDLDGRIYGKVVEQYDYTTALPNVLIDVLDNGDTNTVIRGFSNATGYFRLYDYATEVRDFSWTKTGYITKNYNTTTAGTDYDAPFNDTSAFDAVTLAADSAVEENAAGAGEKEISLGSGIKVTVSYEGGQTVDDATVSLYVCSSTAVGECTTVLDTCTNPSPDCTIDGTGAAGAGASGEYYFSGMATGTHVQVKVVRSGFDTIYDPDPASAATAYTISTSSAITPTFTVINTPPTSLSLIAEGGADYTNHSTNLSVAYVGQDVTTYAFSCDGSTYVNLDGTSPDTINLGTFGGGCAVTEGSKTFWLRATDHSDQVAYTTDEIYLDTTAPGNPTTGGDPGDEDLDGSVMWTWTGGAEAGSGTDHYNVKLDDVAGCGSPIWTKTTTEQTYTVADLTDGTTYYMCVQQVDKAGNTSSYVDLDSDGILIDITAPSSLSLIVENGADYTNHSTNLSVAYVGQDVTTYAFSCDGSTYVNLDGTSPDTIDLSGFGGGCDVNEGTKTLWLRATDANGNQTYITDEIYLDTTNPGTVTTVTDPGTVDEDGVVTWNWTAATDAGSGVKDYEVKVATHATCASGILYTDYVSDLSYTYSGLVDGSTYYACVKARDNVGNEGAAVNSDGILIDTSIPDQVVLNTPLSAGYWTTNLLPVFTWTDVAGENFYQIQVDADMNFSAGAVIDVSTVPAGGTTGDQNTYTAVTPLVSGINYYWRMRAIDSDATDGMWSEIWSFTVDNVAPTALTVNNPAATEDSLSFLAKVTSGEVGLTCKASLYTTLWDSMEYTMADNGDSSYQTTVVSDSEGAKQVKFECRDAAGNAVTTTKNVQVTSTYPAIVKITAPANAGSTNDSTPAIDIEAESAGLTCKYNLTSNHATWGDGSWVLLNDDTDSTYSSAATANLGADGVKTIYFKCQKANGPVPVDAVSTTFTLDTVAASYELTAMSNSLDVKSGDEVEVYYIVDEDLATSPTATIGAKVAVVTRSGRLIKASRVLDGTETDDNVVITGGTDLAGNANATLNDTNRIATDFVVPTLSTPIPADAVTAQTSPIALSIAAGGAETGLDCRYHFSAAKATADIAFDSMGYWMFDNNDGTYGSYVYMPDGTWFVNIKCMDAAGNEGEFGDAAGAGYSFTVGTAPGTVTVTGISATKTYATADGTYANGWAWVFNITAPTLETTLKMKFNNWTGTGGTIAVANNMRFYSTQAAVAKTQLTAIPITVAATYSAIMNLTGDLDANTAGRQIQITVEAKVPIGSAGGSYSNSYGIETL